VINLTVKDSHEEALNGARQTLQLVQMVSSIDMNADRSFSVTFSDAFFFFCFQQLDAYSEDDWADNIDKVLQEFQVKTSKKVIYTILFY